MATKNYNDLNSLYQNGFNWKVGKYSIKYKVYENSLKTPFIKEVIFKMTSLDVSNLTNNIEKCHTEIERNYVGTEFENPTWNWANITIEE